MAATGFTSGDARKLDKTGGTLTGPLVLSDSSTAASQAHVAAQVATEASSRTSGDAASVATAAAGAAGLYLPLAGGTVTGDVAVGTPSACRSLNVISGYVPDAGQDDSDGVDYTGRLNLYSYQRAAFHSYGEVLRIYSRKWDSKQMIAWYGPTSYTAYDSVTDTGGDPVGSDRPWFWMGAHYESNDHGSVHGHWSCEVPDSTGALQTRLEFKIWDPSTGTYGMDKTNIQTNAADFTVRCTNGQVLRLSATSSHNKDIQFNLDHDGSDANQRWRIRVTSSTSDMQMLRYDDSGVLQDAPFIVSRSTGQVQIGGASGTAAGLLVLRSTGSVITVTQTGVGATGVAATMADTTSRATQVSVSGDTTPRHAVFADGKTEWGSGAATRDTNLYRSSADVLRTDDSLHVGVNLRLNTTSLGGGSGVIALANATVAPAGTPTGGGVLFAEGGALKWRNPSGVTTTIAVG